jgi:hypothetical protein
MKTTNNEIAPPQNGFLSALQRHRGGKALEEASEHLAAIVAGVMATGRPGSLTLKLTIQPAGRVANAVVMTDDLNPKIPAEKTPDSFWFADEHGQLCREDPRQRELRFTPQAIPGGADDGPAETGRARTA